MMESRDDTGLATSALAAILLRRGRRHLADWIRPVLFLQAMTTTASPSDLRETAWIDGLRGLAALVVYWYHNVTASHRMAVRILESSFGHEDRYHLTTLPGIRLFFSGGHFAVAVFYVISGYVLSVKPITLLRAGRKDAFDKSLASSLFRRWLRLYIPIFCTTFFYMAFWHLTGIFPPEPPAHWNFSFEFTSWYNALTEYSFIYRWGGAPWTVYNPHLWSITYEMKGSLVIFTCLMAFSRCTQEARWLCTLGLVVYFFCLVDGWWCAAFLGGVIAAEIDLLEARNSLPSLLDLLAPYKKLIIWTSFGFAILLGGAPSDISNIDMLRANPGWYFLSFLVPAAMKDPKWAFLTPGAFMLVLAIPRIPRLKAFFERPSVQYLGRISYALYLLHGPVISLLGERLFAATGMTRDWHFTNIPGWVNTFELPWIGPLGLELCFLATQLISLPFTLWLSDVATRLFDDPTVRFTQWLYKKVLVL